MISKPRTINRILVALSCLLYFTSYITRLNYGAVLADIVAGTAVTKSQAGLIGTALFVTYGVGQIVMGFLGDKVKPQLIITCGLVVTTLCNAVFPLCDNIGFLIFIWGLNGFAQAAFWPPLVRILASRFTKRDYSVAIIWVSAAANIATVLLYLIVPLLLVTLGWQSVFYFAAGLAAIVIPVWAIGTAHLKEPTEKGADDKAAPSAGASETVLSADKTSRKAFWKLLVACNMPCIFIAIAMHGFLKDGITTWMPTYLTETFTLGTSISILVNVALPVFGIIIVTVAAVLQSKLFKNELSASLAYFAVSSVMLLLLFFFSDSHAALSVALSAVTVGCMHGINLMLVSDLPARFVKHNKISTVSGLTNSCTYIGSALSSYLIALLAERIGWQYTILFWMVVAVLGAVLCLASVKLWKKFIVSVERDASSEEQEQEKEQATEENL